MQFRLPEPEVLTQLRLPSPVVLLQLRLTGPDGTLAGLLSGMLGFSFRTLAVVFSAAEEGSAASLLGAADVLNSENGHFRGCELTAVAYDGGSSDIYEGGRSDMILALLVVLGCKILLVMSCLLLQW